MDNGGDTTRAHEDTTNDLSERMPRRSALELKMRQ